MFEVVKDERYNEDLKHYRTVLQYMEANVPLGVLSLGPRIEKILSREGCVRVYDLIDRDLTKIEGLGRKSLDLLTARLDQFLSISI